MVGFWIPIGWTLDFDRVWVGFGLVGLGWCSGLGGGSCLVVVGPDGSALVMFFFAHCVGLI